jgi:hypothetical protein
MYTYRVLLELPLIIFSKNRDSTESPFLSLPGELRNTIYEYALSGHTWDIGWEPKASNPKSML